jgi:hypothetical protein
MTIKIFAKAIPDSVRTELLSASDPIYNAVPVASNPNMKFLLDVWHKYIEPNKEVSNCPICIGNILTNFKQMRDVLIELENEHQYLKNL